MLALVHREFGVDPDTSIIFFYPSKCILYFGRKDVVIIYLKVDRVIFALDVLFPVSL